MDVLVSGMSDLSSFENAMQSGNIPDLSTLTFEGIFGENYFHTGEEKLKDFATTFRTIKRINPIHNEKEYYLGIGMNSKYDGEGLKQQQRLRMNLMIVLDVSGSMAGEYQNSKTKLEIAKDAISLLIQQLKPSDRFGIITFAETAHTHLSFSLRSDISDIKVKEILRDVHASGRTNLEVGLIEAADAFKSIDFNIISDNYSNDHLENNRIVFITDLLPTIGRSDGDSLLLQSSSLVNENIYTTYVGVGLDFNSALVDSISKIKGCNHFSITTLERFKTKIEGEFEYLFTPIIFNAVISFSSNDLIADLVFGSPGYEKPIANQIFYLTSLFPSLRCSSLGYLTKGSILIVKLKPREEIDDSNDDFVFSPIHLSVQYEDRYHNVKFDSYKIEKPFNTPTFKYDHIDDKHNNDDDDGDDDDNHNSTMIVISDQNTKDSKTSFDYHYHRILREAAFFETDENAFPHSSLRKALLCIDYISLVQQYISQINQCVTSLLPTLNNNMKINKDDDDDDNNTTMMMMMMSEERCLSPNQIEERCKYEVDDVYARFTPLFTKLTRVFEVERSIFTPRHQHIRNYEENDHLPLEIRLKCLKQHRSDLDRYPITFEPILNLKSKAMKRDLNSSIIDPIFSADLDDEIAHFRATRQHINFRKSHPPTSSSSTKITTRDDDDEPRTSKVEVIFSFDTTGSMGKSIDEAKEKIIAITNELFAKLTSKYLRIGVIAHGDYCDPKEVIFQTFPLSADPKTVITWIKGIKNGGGGDAPENYEQVLEYVSDYTKAGWSEDASKIVVLIGDAKPHDEFECEEQMIRYNIPNPRRINWKHETEKCYMQGIKIYSVRANHNEKNGIAYFYMSLAARTCGAYLPLSNFSTLADLISMICFKEYSPDSLTQYENELRLQNRMDNERLVLFDLLSSN